MDNPGCIGGGAIDEARSVVLDGTTEACFGGWTTSDSPTPFPTTLNAYDTTFNGGSVTGDGFASWFTLPPVQP
jgi:hypothetical protein